jgi:hypothetical protein
MCAERERVRHETEMILRAELYRVDEQLKNLEVKDYDLNARLAGEMQKHAVSWDLMFEARVSRLEREHSEEKEKLHRALAEAADKLESKSQRVRILETREMRLRAEIAQLGARYEGRVEDDGSDVDDLPQVQFYSGSCRCYCSICCTVSRSMLNIQRNFEGHAGTLRELQICLVRSGV